MSDEPECRTRFYSLEIQGKLAAINFHGDVHQLGACLESKKTLLSALDFLDKDPRIHALLLSNSAGVLGAGNFRRFMETTLETPDGSGGPRGRTNAAMCLPHYRMDRFGNALNQFLMKITGFSKVVVVAYEGEVASPLFGLGLAADFRLASTDMTLLPSHIEWGIAPGGGLGYFLPRLVGPLKARDLLFSKEPTSAEELREMGLLDRVLPVHEYRSECVQATAELADIPLPGIAGIKAVLNNYSGNLINFLVHEEDVRGRTTDHRGFKVQGVK